MSGDSAPLAPLEETLAAIVELLRHHGELRWAAAFRGVAEHVSVSAGATDPLSPARTVRDLLHMFGEGVETFMALELRREGIVDREATRALHSLHRSLHITVASFLGRAAPPITP